RNFQLSMESLLNMDEKLIDVVEENEEVIDYLNQAITTYLVKLNGLSLEDSDRVRIGSFYHVVSDMERIGDHAENICELASMAINKNEIFSSIAIGEINDLKKLVDTVMDNSLEMFESRSYSQRKVDLISNTEQEIDDKTDLYKANHIERLSDGKCSARVGTLFMELLTNLERIADHSTNIAFSLYPNQHAPHSEAEAMQLAKK
ncbi:MAG: Na/Pi cotransporter family protein, partial [Clostridia bacterium]|nr:Na/Pi cotransporter family protein [Clostridia bacterium]